MSVQHVKIVALADVEADAWDNVAEASARSPMVLRDWVDSAVATYGAEAEAKAVVVGDPAAPRAVLPLMREEGPIARYFFAGNEGGAVRVACRDTAAADQLAQAIVRFGYPVNFGHCPTGSPLIAQIRTHGTGRVLIASRPLERRLAPFLDLDASWAEPERHLSKSRMQAIRRRERQLKALGDLKVRFLTPDADAADAALDIAFRVEARGWKQAEGLALASDARQAAFYRRYARAIAARGRLHITLLELDDTPIAMSIGEVYNGTYWAYKTGFDSDFRKYAPGILLQYHLVRHLAGQGLKKLDFQGQLDDFKQIWTDRAVDAAAFRIYPINLRGAVALAYDLSRHGRTALAGRVSRARAAARRRPEAQPAEQRTAS